MLVGLCQVAQLGTLSPLIFLPFRWLSSPFASSSTKLWQPLPFISLPALLGRIFLASPQSFSLSPRDYDHLAISMFRPPSSHTHLSFDLRGCQWPGPQLGDGRRAVVAAHATRLAELRVHGVAQPFSSHPISQSQCQNDWHSFLFKMIPFVPDKSVWIVSTLFHSKQKLCKWIRTKQNLILR